MLLLMPLLILLLNLESRLRDVIWIHISLVVTIVHVGSSMDEYRSDFFAEHVIVECVGKGVFARAIMSKDRVLVLIRP